MTAPISILIPLLPLLGWVVLGLAGGRWGRRTIGAVACGTVLASLLVTLILWAQLQHLPAGARHADVDVYRWFAAGPYHITFRLLVDPLSMTMALMVCGVGALIHIYSIGYMEGDPGLARYFAFMNLFTASMLILALAGNLPVMFIGWEGVGLCSYLLIAFWFTRPAAAAAGVKAFLVTRLGDVGFLIGIFLAFAVFGHADFTLMTRQAATRLPLGGAAATALALLLFAGATGKSAQLPLYVWLPDAMEGPTPVSALIHAATMVTAGVYMIVRMHAVYVRAPLAMDVVAIVGAVTAIFSAASALVETDLKRVLAYSTISQLGYMFLAVGVGAWSAGMFHLTAHAFFKALLFLAAGGVMHALGGETDMRRMGGLAPRLPVTAASFTIGALALAGIPPLVGFFSKEHILSDVFGAGYVWLWLLGIVTSGLTGFYIVRAFVLTFVVPAAGGRDGRAAGSASAHDPPPVMRRPMWALGILSIIGGVLGRSLTRPGVLDRWLRPVVQAGVGRIAPLHEPAALVVVLAGVGTAVAAAGLAVGWFAVTRRGMRSPGLETVLAHQFYVEDAYNVAIVNPLRRLARSAAYVDRNVIDGTVVEIARMVGHGGRELRRFQTGYLRQYAALVLAGALLLLIYWMWR
jgi:NADH-quinone oxidoreductase subunit L